MPYAPSDYLPYDFANRRHIGPSPEEMADMLEVLGVESLDTLIDQTVPEDIRQTTPLDFGKPMSEREMLHHMEAVAGKNKVLVSLIGQGYHGTMTPPRSSGTFLKTLPGTRPTRHTSQRFRKAVWKPC